MHSAHQDTTQPHRPATKSELIFLCILFFTAIFPSSAQPIFSSPPFYTQWFNIILLVVGFIGFMLASVRVIKFPVKYITLLLWIILIISLSGVQSSPSLEEHGAFSLLYPTLVLILMPYCAFLLIKLVRGPSTNGIYMLSITVGLITLVYIVTSTVGPMLGFRGGELVSIGGDRISGSIGNAATLHLIILPALAVFFEFPKRTISWIGIAVCIVGLGLTFSRASLVGLFLIVAYQLIMNRRVSLNQKTGAMVALVLVASAIIIIADSDLLERIMPSVITQDYARSETWETSFEAWEVNPITGLGYSHMWPWYARQGELIAGLRLNRWDGILEFTEYGRTLWNPHSLILYFGVELGFFGLGIVLLTFKLIALRLFSSPSRGLALALIVSAVMDFTTNGAFYSFPFNILIWWLFCMMLILRQSEKTVAKKKDKQFNKQLKTELT